MYQCPPKNHFWKKKIYIYIYTYIILDIHHPDATFTSEREWRPVVIFRSKIARNSLAALSTLYKLTVFSFFWRRFYSDLCTMLHRSDLQKITHTNHICWPVVCLSLSALWPSMSASWSLPIPHRHSMAHCIIGRTRWRYKPEGHEFDFNVFIGIFHCHKPSGRTMALGSTQPLTEISKRNIYPGGVMADGA